jgi:hypothetical protein
MEAALDRFWSCTQNSMVPLAIRTITAVSAFGTVANAKVEEK